ncbi:lamin tail domain-containing protein [Candidatus Woesearchaeota archaeon]|nr:lamin tail domain-containing protein [Candidatus Woesearchaeota archaeon]
MKFVYIVLTVALILSADAFAEVMVTEIMYDPEGSDTGREWIELYNSGSSAVDITGWKFNEDGSNHGLTIYQGSLEIAPGGSMIIARNGDSFMADHTGYPGNIVTATFSLVNSGGEELYIMDDELSAVDYVNLSTNEENEGYSIELKNTGLDNSDMMNWEKGPYRGDPGAVQEGDSAPSQVPEFNIIGVALMFALCALVFLKKR